MKSFVALAATLACAFALPQSPFDFTSLAAVQDPATDYCQCFGFNNDIADAGSTQSICTKLSQGYTYYAAPDPQNPQITYPGCYKLGIANMWNTFTLSCGFRGQKGATCCTGKPGSYNCNSWTYQPGQ